MKKESTSKPDQISLLQEENRSLRNQLDRLANTVEEIYQQNQKLGQQLEQVLELQARERKAAKDRMDAHGKNIDALWLAQGEVATVMGVGFKQITNALGQGKDLTIMERVKIMEANSEKKFAEIPKTKS